MEPAPDSAAADRSHPAEEKGPPDDSLNPIMPFLKASDVVVKNIIH
jgi:hypothetical protein